MIGEREATICGRRPRCHKGRIRSTTQIPEENSDDREPCSRGRLPIRLQDASTHGEVVAVFLPCRQQFIVARLARRNCACGRRLCVCLRICCLASLLGEGDSRGGGE